jgi:predicted PurR-regulated permease PerM
MVSTPGESDSEREITLRRRAGFLVATAALGLLVAAAPLTGGIVSAIVLAVLLDGPYIRLSARIGPNRAAAVLLVGCLLLVCIPALVVADLAWSQARNLNPAAFSTAGWRLPFGDQSVRSSVDSITEQVGARLTSALVEIATWTAGTAAHGALNIGVMFLCLFFALRSGSQIWHRVRTYLPFSDESRDALAIELQRVTKATVLGTVLSAVLQGFSMAIGFIIAGFPVPVFWGIVTAFTSMLPVLGSALVWVPAVVLSLIHNQAGPAIVILIFGWLVPSAIDKVTRAVVSRHVGNVHPLTTLLGALIGIRIFGLVGLVVGPLIIATFFELLNLYDRDYGVVRPASAPQFPAAPPSSTEEVR